jgi:1-acyl-sn-glycerol-3-phosphate acyltransferase
MIEHLARAWRIGATGICFACFGIGGLLLRVVVFPLLACLLRVEQAHRQASKDVIHFAFRGFILLMCGLGVIRYEIRNAERLRRSGLLIVANHPTLIDVVFLIALVRKADCVVKAALLRNPFTRGPLRAAGYVCNDAGPALVDDCLASLRAGNNLLIFPEGTRTPLRGPIKLQRGAANIAVRGQRALTPVTIRCEPSTLTKGEKWYQVPRRRPHFHIEVHEDVQPEAWTAPGMDDAQAVRRLTRNMSEFFSRETRREGA